jgi:5-methylcytosine-specific restriction endonuclease McrA
MPNAASKPCSAPGGCAALVPAGVRYCRAHSQSTEAADRARRGSSTGRGYGSRWQKYRADFLLRFPLCGMGPSRPEPKLGADPRDPHSQCRRAGRITPAAVVDHIAGASNLGVAEASFAHHRMFWNVANHQALCTACHNAKTARGNQPLPLAAAS